MQRLEDNRTGHGVHTAKGWGTGLERGSAPPSPLPRDAGPVWPSPGGQTGCLPRPHDPPVCTVCPVPLAVCPDPPGLGKYSLVEICLPADSYFIPMCGSPMPQNLLDGHNPVKFSHRRTRSWLAKNCWAARGSFHVSPGDGAPRHQDHRRHPAGMCGQQLVHRGWLTPGSVTHVTQLQIS